MIFSIIVEDIGKEKRRTLRSALPTGANLPTLWLFEPANRPDDTADGLKFPSFSANVLVFTNEWAGPRPPAETGVDSW